MKKKTINLVVTVSVVLLLSAGTFIVRSVNDKKEEAESAEENPLLSNAEKMDLRKIEIQNSDGPIEFVSDDGEEWTSEPPTKHFRWDKEKISQLINTASRLKSLRRIEDSASREKKDEYGLAHPESTVILHDSRELKVSLFIGDVSPTGSGRYASNDTGEIFLIAESDAEIMLKDAEGFRDLSLPSVSADADSIKSFEYRRTGTRVKIIREDDKLVMTEPWRANVDKELFNNITSSGSAIPREVDEYKDQFLWNAPFFGLDESADYLIIEDDEENMLNILIGGEVGSNQHYAITGDREDSLFLLSKLKIGFMNKQPFDFIEKTIVKASLDEISEISVDSVDTDTGQFLIQKKEISSIYEKLAQLVRDSLAPEARRTDKPDIEIIIKTTDGDKEIELWDYDESSYAASISGDEKDFLINRKQVDSLIKEMAEIKTKE